MNATDNSSPGPMFPSDPALDGETRVPLMLGVVITFGSLSTISLLLRIYTRVKILKIFDKDDWLMVFAQILNIGLIVMIGLDIKYGLGTHIWTQSPDNMVPSLKLFYSTVILYLFALNTVKMSILYQIRGIFTGKGMQMVTTFGIIFIILWTITGVFLSAFICIPVSSFWDLTIQGKCLGFEAVYYTMAGINILTDFAIFSMPLTVIKTLHLPKKQKISLFFIFSLGFFTCCVSIIRLHTLIIGATSQDPSWDEVAVTNWTFIELATAVTTACFATLRPLIYKIMPSLLSNRMEYTYDNNYSGSDKGSDIKTPGFMDSNIGNNFSVNNLENNRTTTDHVVNVRL